jgi:hypothetical protein
MKKLRSFVLAVVSLAFLVSVTYAKTNAETVFNTEKVNKGVITVNYTSTNDKKIKLLVEKIGKQYSYTLSGKTQESFPLQMGSGTYKVSVLENVSGNSYRIINQSSIDVNIENENDIYLNSIQNINWNDTMAAVKKATELTKNVKSNDEKVKILYVFTSISGMQDKAACP